MGVPEDKGKDLEKSINNNNLCILNNKSPTYLNPSTGSYSAIDITLFDPSSYVDYKCKIYNNLCKSNHFLDSPQPLHDDRLSQWKINKANWEKFKILCNQKLIWNPNNKDLTKHFIETLISIEKETIPKISPLNWHNMP